MLLKDKIDFFDLVIFSSFFLFICLAGLAAVGWFKPVFVWLALAVIAGAFLFFRTQIIWPQKFWLILLLVIIIAGGFAFLRGWYSGDAYDRWLPVGREIAKTGFFPTELFQHKYSNVAPILPLLIALTFTVTHSVNAAATLWIPFLFTALTIVLILKWLQEKNIDSRYLYFVPLVFLGNSVVQSAGGWNLLPESILLFFATAFFYYYEKYLEEPKNYYLILLLFSFSLALVAKIFMGVAVLLLVPLFFKSRKKRQFVGISILLMAPAWLWFLRNYLLFDNPFFPIMDNYFVGRFSPYLDVMKSFLLTPAGFESIWARYFYVLTGIFVAFPVIWLAIFGFITSKKIRYLFLMIFYFLIKEMLFFSYDSSVRYYYLFFGLMSVYAILALSKLRSKLLISIFIFLAFWSLLLVPFWESASSFIASVENYLGLVKNVLWWLASHRALTLLILLLFILLAVRKKDIKIFLIFLFSLNILHLEFLYNKSWVVSWTIIGAALLLLIIYSFKKTQLNLRIAALIIIGLAALVAPWLLGGIYYYRHGLSFPPHYVHQAGKWSIEILNRLVPENERNKTLLVVDDIPDYYHWFSDYSFAVFNQFDFWKLVDLKYNDNLPAEKLHQLLTASGVQYIVRTNLEHQEHYPFFEKLAASKDFVLVKNFEDKYFLWQVKNSNPL